MVDDHDPFSRELLHSPELELDLLLQRGIFKPILPYHLALFTCLPLVGLIIPRRPGTKFVRLSIFILCLGYGIETIRSRRALVGGNGYIIGLWTSWWLVWNATLLVFTDIERDYRRIARQNFSDTSNLVGASSICSNCLQQCAGDSEKKSRLVCELDHKESLGIRIPSPTPGIPLSPHDKLYWQCYPLRLSHRVIWCIGLYFNLRGAEWNWRISGLGPLPPDVYAQLSSGFLSGKVYAEDTAAHSTGRQRLVAALVSCLKSYLLLDILKVLMMRDPYYRGNVSQDGAVPPFPFNYLTCFPLMIRIYHFMFAYMFFYIALTFFMSFIPIIYLGLSLAFPQASRKMTSAPLDAPWLYPDTFGPTLSVFDDGLAGFWGRHWHQLLRHGFTSTARWTSAILFKGRDMNPWLKRGTHIMVVFSLSGFMHACGSYTQFKRTNPVSGPFLFFCLQGIAIVFEDLSKGLLAVAPRLIRRILNGVFIFCWFAFSGPLITDDLAIGGLWLVEILPISPLRGLGLAMGDGWWCWQGPWFRYWSAGTYLGTGFRLS